MTIVNGWKLLPIVIKSSILDIGRDIDLDIDIDPPLAENDI